MADYRNWIEAAVTLAMLSYVFSRDNPFYRFCQAAYLGVALGNAVVVSWDSFIRLGAKPLAAGDLVLLVPVVLGLLMYTRYIPRIAWMGRYGMALLVSLGAALGIRGAVQAQFLDQIIATFKPLNSIDNIIIVVGTLCVTAYFFFLKSSATKFSGYLSVVPTLGKTVMMVAFGATFGTTVMGRVSLLINRVQFLMGGWLGLLK